MICLAQKNRQHTIFLLLTLTLVIVAIYDTKIVRIGGNEDIQREIFSADDFAFSTFPRIRHDVIVKSVDIKILSKSLSQDAKATIQKYGVKSGIGTVLAVSFTGIANKGNNGTFTVVIDDFNNHSLGVHLQTGPVINGTDLRDATGKINFSQFKNQIEYQNAAAALNNEMKTQIFSTTKHHKLDGKHIAVVGVFKLINPDNWLITPVKLNIIK
ncbi:MAG: DUF2291 family protein [Ostreibacterium sp.]